MRHTCRYSQNLERLAFLSIVVAFCASPSLAQQELQIMVSGPWAYVADQANHRLFLVAPRSQHHQAYIFGGTNAANFPNQTAISTGVYALNIASRATYSKVPQEAALLYAVSISDPSLIGSVLSGKSPHDASLAPYVISLPTPDDFSTYVDPNETFDGYSEMKVYGPNKVSTPQAVPPQLYTTWMVLRYSVKNIPATVTGQGPNGALSYSTSGSPAGVSIVMGAPDQDPDLKCDSVSVESFQDQSKLWGLNQMYVRFPKELKSMPGHQTQQKHFHYAYDCKADALDMSMPKNVAPRPAPQNGSLAAGSADCHMAQISINGAMQNP